MKQKKYLDFQHLVVAYLAIFLAVVQGQDNDETYRGLINDYNNGVGGADGAINLCNKQSLANWNVQTNVGVQQYVAEQVNRM